MAGLFFNTRGGHSHRPTSPGQNLALDQSKGQGDFQLVKI